MVIIDAARTAYSAKDIYGTFTVAELIETLSQYDPDEKVILSHDGGYTYGGIGWNDVHNHDELDME